jgi:demethylmenaquinone methyltransferase/2-methoxy-6-polyprenyl-1,4-benzoquinol methylase
MPFRSTFDCLWCGTSYATRGASDIEGWAQLCPDCVGKAGDNGFLRFRLHQALKERAASAGGDETGADGSGAKIATPVASVVGASSVQDPERAMIDYYEARAPEYDDWYLRRGRYERGAVHDAAWNAELDAAGRWLDSLPWQGEIVELAAGTGWWSPLLASRGELSLYDTSPSALDRARERLVAHGLRAHLHVRDAWAEPDRQVDGLFLGFWLSHVPRARLAGFLELAHRWLKPGGRLAFIDSLPDAASGAIDHPHPADDLALRRLDDGREFTIVKVDYEADELEAVLIAVGFDDIDVSTTGRFFLLGSAKAV